MTAAIRIYPKKTRTIIRKTFLPRAKTICQAPLIVIHDDYNLQVYLYQWHTDMST